MKVWRRTETGEAPRWRGLADVRGCESVPRTKADDRETGAPAARGLRGGVAIPGVL